MKPLYMLKSAAIRIYTRIVDPFSGFDQATMTAMMATASLPTTCIFKCFTARKVIPSAFIETPPSLSSTRSVSRSFGLRSSPNFRAFAMAVHKVKLIGPGTWKGGIWVRGLGCCLHPGFCGNCRAWSAVFMPCWCLFDLRRAASIRFCRPVRGSFLDDLMMKKGYVLMWIYPISDCVIHTHKESEFY